MILKYYKLNFQTKNYSNKSSKSAKAKGIIYFIVDTDNLWTIIDSKIDFHEVWFDSYHTAAHFSDPWKADVIKFRDDFCRENNLKLKKRTNKTRHNIHELNQAQLNSFNIKINEYLRIKTLKGLILMLKGSNPSGSIKKPRNSEFIVIDKNGNKYYNFPILFDSISYITDNGNWKWENLVYSDDFFIDLMNNSLNKSEELKNFHEILEDNDCDSSIKNDQRKSVKNKIKKITGKFSVDTVVKKYIRKYYAEIETLNIQAFDCKGITQKCHIYNVGWVKDQIMTELKNNKSMKNKYTYSAKEIQDNFKNNLEIISDKYNYLNLSPNFHQHFDKFLITYDSESGELTELSENFNPYYDELRTFSNINKEFLKYCSKYLKQRLEKIQEIKNSQS